MAEGERLFIGTGVGLITLGDPTGAGLWRELARALTSAPVRAIVALDAETLLAAPDGLPPQQSFDGGQTWVDAPGVAIAPVGLRAATAAGPVELLHPRLMGATAYARLGGRNPMLLGAGAGGGLLFRSADDGIHWEPAAGAVAGRVAAIAPSVRAGCAWAGTDSGQILRTADRGASWHEVARLAAAVLCLAAALTS